MSLLDSLQALARGDAAGKRPEERFDLAELLDAAVHAGRRRHPLLRVRVNECPNQAELRGWPEGVRSIIDNLLQNAACHAGSHARVELALCTQGHRLVLTVDDDGPGVPEAERHRRCEVSGLLARPGFGQPWDGHDPGGGRRGRRGVRLTLLHEMGMGDFVAPTRRGVRFTSADAAGSRASLG